MIFDSTDIELLRLVGWCKNLPTDMNGRFEARVFHPQILEQMEMLGLVNETSNHSSIRLRPKGWKLLRYLGYDYHRDAGYVADYKRRIEIANILLTFYRAGYDVFAKRPDDLVASRVFLQAPVARRDSSPGDLWGGASFHGIASIEDYVTACYFVTGHEEAQLHRRNERLLLDKAAVILRRRESQIFAGDNYLSIAKMLMNPAADDAKKKTSQKKTYAEIYQNASCPLFLLECSDAGAFQLLIMAQEDYRRRLGIAITKSGPEPPVGIHDADGEVLLPGEQYPSPWILAVDMNVKRIDRALRQSINAGYKKLLIVCLKEQEKALQYLYGKSGRAAITKVIEEDITDAFGNLKLYEPKPAAYLDRDGGVIDVANLPYHREA